MKYMRIEVKDQHGKQLVFPDYYPCQKELTIVVTLPESDAEQRRVPDSASLELLRRFYQAWQGREDDNVIDALIMEMGAVLETEAGG
jgi:hypothetical protein